MMLQPAAAAPSVVATKKLTRHAPRIMAFCLPRRINRMDHPHCWNPQTPFRHMGAVDGQTFPHPPQWSGFVLVLTQDPLQNAWPPAQFCEPPSPASEAASVPPFVEPSFVEASVAGG